MPMTLLEMTQNILSAMSSDEVNSIGDTTESLQVAHIIRQKYKDIIARVSIPEQNELFQLTASSDPTLPTVMYIPDEVSRLDWVKYFNHDDSSGTEVGYRYVTILPIQQFIDFTNLFSTDEDNVVSYTFDDFTFKYKNDVTPTYCTILSNSNVLFDSYNSALDDTLQETNTMCYGQITPVFSLTDSFIPNLNEKEFSLLVNEAKALAFFELKQMSHPKAEQEIMRQWSALQDSKAVNNIPSPFDRLPNYGR